MIRTSSAQFRIPLMAAAMAAALLTACSAADGGSSPGADASKELLIGVSAPMADPIYGQVVAGFEARLKVANAGGGIGGHTFKVVARDNKATPDGGATTVRSLLAEKPFAMMVQGSGSYSSGALILKTQQTQMPVFVVASATVVKKANLPNAFGLYNDYVRECFLNVDYLVKTLALKNVAIAYQDDALGQTSGEQCPAYAKSLGVAATAVPVASGTTDFGSPAAKLRDSGAQGVVVVALAPSVAGLQSASAKLGYKPAWVTFSGNATSANLFTKGTFITNWLRSVSDPGPETAKFTAGVKQYAPTAETPLGASGWTIGEVLVDAVESASKGGDLTQAKMIEVLKAFERPDGIAMADGAMSYVNDQSTLVTALAMNQWNGSELVQVAEPEDLPPAP